MRGRRKDFTELFLSRLMSNDLTRKVQMEYLDRQSDDVQFGNLAQYSS